MCLQRHALAMGPTPCTCTGRFATLWALRVRFRTEMEQPEKRANYKIQ